MKSLFAPLARTGGSLAALAAVLALALPVEPAAAQDRSRPSRVERAQPRAEVSGRPQRVALPRAQAPRVPRAARAEAPRPQRAARPPRPVAQTASARRASRGFGGELADRTRAAQQQAQRQQRAVRIDQRSEQRAGRVDQRFERRADQVERRGDAEARRLDRRGFEGAANRVDRRTDRVADRIEDRGDRRADRIEDRGDRRADRVDGRVGDIRARGGRFERGGGGFDGQVRDIARDARRLDQRADWRGDRRGWRQDDWRWGYNGRPGWDRRDFRRWDNRWRFDRRYDYNDFRRGNRFVFRPGPYYAPFRSHRYSRLGIGFFLDSLFFQPRYFINDPYAYRLPPVYGPYQWVRYYDDVVLVDIYTGEVVDVIHDFFW